MQLQPRASRPQVLEFAEKGTHSDDPSTTVTIKSRGGKSFELFGTSRWALGAPAAAATGVASASASASVSTSTAFMSPSWSPSLSVLDTDIDDAHDTDDAEDAAAEADGGGACPAARLLAGGPCREQLVGAAK